MIVRRTISILNIENIINNRIHIMMDNHKYNYLMINLNPPEKEPSNHTYIIESFKIKVSIKININKTIIYQNQ